MLEVAPPQPTAEPGDQDTVREPKPEPAPAVAPDLEWLFERDRDAPLGWAFGQTEEPTGQLPTDPSRPDAEPRDTAGRKTDAWRDEGRTGRSPWMVLAVFVAILLLLMLVSYIGGMAFSTVVNR